MLILKTYNTKYINIKRYDILMQYHDEAIKSIDLFFQCSDKSFIVCIVPLLKALYFSQYQYIWETNQVSDSSKYKLISLFHGVRKS